MPSIVVPAHDEERSIRALLVALEPLREEVEVVVVANGCSDRTAEIARESAPWATVLELAEGSKPAALDTGDGAATSFPRLYLDADVVIDAQAVRQLFAALDRTPGLEAAAATPQYDLRGCSVVVRSHHRFWERLPANQNGLAGTNAMAVTQAGRGRFDAWPRLIGDDYFLDGLFADHEKTRIADAPVQRPTSRRFGDTVSRKARIHQGNVDVRAAELRAAHGGGGLGGAVTVVVREPARVLDLPAHLAVTVATRVLSAWRRRRGTAQVWFRDESRAG